MRRRQFLWLTAAAMGFSATRLRATTHFVSFDPLIVEFDLASLEGRYTRVEDFYIRNHYQAPTAPEAPSIEIGGEVEKPVRLGLDVLQRLPEQRIGAVLECAGDPATAVSLVSDGLWEGWPLADVISLSKPGRQGLYAHLLGGDGFSRSVTLSELEGGFLATRLNGRPLIRNHGAPWRALFPGLYGMNSIKWLQKITLVAVPLPPAGNTYQEIWRGSSGSIERKPLPPIQVKSVITKPKNGAVLHRGKLEIGGLAWSGSGKIVEVQVSADGGNHWRMATLDSSSSRYDWSLWRAAFDLNQSGVVELVSKATDSAGHTQPASRDPRRLDLYAYNVWERIRCVVV
ncbi:MAG: molybdopterin-dependent oxidoreductase [Terriglobia bacterium]